MFAARCAVFALVVATAAPARADVPWAAGVAPAVQTKANALFGEANQLFAQQAHTAAVEKYRAALALWDHPLIRYNLAVTLIRLDRILEAADELERSLRYAATPFSTELYQQAQDYQRLIAGRIGTVEVSCTQGGGQIQLDGQPLLACPGKASKRVLSGEHTVLGEKANHLTISRRLVVGGGASTKADFQFVPIDAAVRFEYPVKRWVPWTIAGVGAAVGFGGLALYLAGQNELDDFAKDYAIACPRGCADDLSDVPELRDRQDSALFKGKLGTSAMIAGGAIAVGGIVWGIFINRPHRVLPKVEVSPSGDGMSAQRSWQY
jgi:tetratricopeptide (TPR) repeat protein